MGILTTINRIASLLELQATAWLDLLRGTYTYEANPIPQNIRLNIETAMEAKLISPEVRLELAERL